MVFATIDTTLAALILSGSVLFAIVALTVIASDKSAETQKNMFGVIGVLVGILAGGGVGTILGTQAGETAAADVKQDVQEQVQQAADAP